MSLRASPAVDYSESSSVFFVGPSRLELLDEFQTQSDYLTSTVSGIRQACAVALKSAQAGPLKIAVFAAVDALCRLTPIAVTQARNLAGI